MRNLISDLRPEPIEAVVEVDDGSFERIWSLLLLFPLFLGWITPGICCSLDTTTITSSYLSSVSFSLSLSDDEVAMAAMVVTPYS